MLICVWPLGTWPTWYTVETRNAFGDRRLRGTYTWSELCQLLWDTREPARVVFMGF